MAVKSWTELHSLSTAGFQKTSSYSRWQPTSFQGPDFRPCINLASNRAQPIIPNLWEWLYREKHNDNNHRVAPDIWQLDLSSSFGLFCFALQGKRVYKMFLSIFGSEVKDEDSVTTSGARLKGDGQELPRDTNRLVGLAFFQTSFMSGEVHKTIIRKQTEWVDLLSAWG